MAEEYYKSCIDTFLPSMDIKPKDSNPFGYAQENVEKTRQQILNAGQQIEKLVTYRTDE